MSRLDQLAQFLFDFVESLDALWIVRVSRWGGSVAICIFGALLPAIWSFLGWFISVMIVICAIALVFLVGLVEHGERVRQRAAMDSRERALDAISLDTAGYLRRLLKELIAKRDVQKRPDEFAAELRNLQQRLLDQVRRHLRSSSELRGDIWCNWVVAESAGDEFSVQVANEDHSRQRKRHPIAEGIPGASRAFLTHDAQIVTDTHAPEIAEHFDQSAPYRSILSVPVSIDVEPGDPRMIGVLNVDSSVPNEFELRHVNLVAEYAYLTGICQVFIDDPRCLKRP